MMKPGLQLRLSQHLALTPQLQQSIRLLQLSTLELQQEVGTMLETNPFLEEDDDGTGGNSPEIDASRAEASSALAEGQYADAHGIERDTAPASGEETSGENQFGDIDWSRTDGPANTDWADGDWSGAESGDWGDAPSRRNTEEEDDTSALDWASAGTTLPEHLSQQARSLRLSPEDATALMVLIESLNEDGYLADPLDEIADRLLDTAHHTPETLQDDQEELLGRLSCALRWLQSLDPAGIGARDLSECLTLQLRQLPPSPAQDLALALCSDHLNLLARRDTRKLMAATGADEPLLRAAHQLILTLDPKPGRQYAATTGTAVIPDVIVKRLGRQWAATLNPEVMPKLRINDIYAQALRQHRGNDGAPALAARLQEARWFVKNIQQRFDTILRVSQAIVERQKNFFTHGEIAMRPLVLREIADELGLHESTISRVTTAKYMLTPFGTFELKYFFGSSLTTEAGGNASSTAVRALLKQLVSNEDRGKPLSDSDLAKMLAEQGIQVARRTVAKYRESLKIAPANLRKTV